MSIRETIIASIRQFLLEDTTLVTALGHTANDNKIVADKVDFDLPQPFVTLVIPRGGLENRDPVMSFDTPVTIRVNGQNLRQLYEIYGLIETLLINAQLPDYNGWRFYVPVRLLDVGFFESFKKSQQDFYMIGCTIRVRGVGDNGN